MPQRLMFGLAATGFAAWSLFVLLAWLMVMLGGDVLRLLAPVLFFGHPDGPTIVDRGADLLVALGGWAVAVVWLAGCAVIGVVTFILQRLAGGVRMARVDVRYARHADYAPAREVKDVTPPDAPDRHSSGGTLRRLSGPVIDQD